MTRYRKYSPNYRKYWLRNTLYKFWVQAKNIRYGYLIPLAIIILVLLLYPFDFLFDRSYTAQTKGTVTHVKTQKGFRQSQYKGNYEYISAYIVNYHFTLDSQVYYKTSAIAPQRITAKMWQKFKNQLNQEVFQIKYNPNNPDQCKLVIE